MSPPPDDYEKFVKPSAAEELHQHAELPIAIGTDPTDGLPAQVAPRNFDKSPPLTEDTLVCMGDRRSFVIRNQWGDVLQSFTPAVVLRFPNGDYYVLEDHAEESVKASAGEQGLRGLLPSPGAQEVFLAYLIVEPVRPPCAHYIRMQTDLAADRDARYIMRACAVQRDESGEYYSVRDSLISACTLRSPRHYESEQLLDAFDADKIAQAKIRLEEESFDIDSALEKEKSTEKGGGLGVLG